MWILKVAEYVQKIKPWTKKNFVFICRKIAVLKNAQKQNQE